MPEPLPTPRPPRVVRSRMIAAAGPEVWDIVGNLRRHDRLIPMTIIDAPDRITRAGDAIVARSAGVVDRMITTRVRERGQDPRDPRWARWASFEKQGPVLLGTAHLVVSARGTSSCLVLWAEEVDLAPGHGLLGTLAGAVPRLAVDLTLAAMSDLALLRLSRVATLTPPPLPAL